MTNRLQGHYRKEFNRDPSQLLLGSVDNSTIDDQAGVLKALEERVLNLWRRQSRKISPEHELRIKFLGEDGIDSGALTKEFLTLEPADTGKKIFPMAAQYTPQMMFKMEILKHVEKYQQ